MGSPFDIDLGNLHVEWAKQSRLYKKAADDLAEAKQKVDAAKARLDVVAAELTLAISSDPEKFDLKKTSELIIKAAVLVQPEHRKAVKTHIRLKYEAAMFQNAVEALEQKKKALECEVQLHLNDYWSEPQVRDAKTRERFADEGKRRVRNKGRTKA